MLRGAYPLSSVEEPQAERTEDYTGFGHLQSLPIRQRLILGEGISQ